MEQNTIDLIGRFDAMEKEQELSEVEEKEREAKRENESVVINWRTMKGGVKI